MLIHDPGFATAVTNDVNVVNSARTGYRAKLGCNGRQLARGL